MTGLRLTKTKYLSALQCTKRLWSEEFAPQRAARRSHAQHHTLRQGIVVGELARERFPGGVLIEARGHAALAQTALAIAGGATALFEAAFLYDDIYIRCDILVRNDAGGWNLLEVKGGTKVKEEYLDDVAIQLYVLEGAGLRIGTVSVMYIDSKNCRYPDLNNLFRIDDVTERARSLTPYTVERIAEIRRLVRRDHEPQVRVGLHCNSPYPCPIKQHCWANIPAANIFTIPRIRPEQVAALVERDIYSLEDVPNDAPLTTAQWSYVKNYRSATARLDVRRAKAWFARLVYPIYFFDFETVNFAVPRYEGVGPYTPVPVQYSCHILHENGDMEHREYLHTHASDPRLDLIHALERDLGRKGSIVVYYKPFERGVLQAMARCFPKHATLLNGFVRRLRDQRDLFTKAYSDPRFLGSTSIKKVLPVLVPELSYDDLEVQRGDDALALWVEMIETNDPAWAATISKNLRDYCKRDTFAMTAIHRVMLERIQASETNGK
jgi:CRISPR/Cas system-associated exonuclease Cas4 (RecB family)